MHTHTIATNIGPIRVHESGIPDGPELVLLHGMFFDHSLWAKQIMQLTHCRCLAVDMPGHGWSKNVRSNWTMDHCARMLLEILRALDLEHATVAGHSWGAMTALRAAASVPDRMRQLLLFNMPVMPASRYRTLGFTLQRALLPMRSFYGKQVAMSLYSPGFLRQHPEKITTMVGRLRSMSATQIWRTIHSVVIDADFGQPYLDRLKVPCHLFAGDEDHLRQGHPPNTEILLGGHVSPEEAAEDVAAAIEFRLYPQDWAERFVA